MDWLESMARRCRQYMKDTSLANSMAVYMLFAVFAGIACTMLTKNLTAVWIQVMERNEEASDFVIAMLRTVYTGCPYLYGAAALVTASRRIVKHSIMPMLEETKTAVDYMVAGDLSYEIAYESENELGKLCKKTGELQKRLRQEKIKQWEAGEEQRKINMAFAHDMRTPLTVIKGYTEFLQKYVPLGKVSQESLLEKLEAIGYQEERLFAFSKTMTKLQQIEKWEMNCKRIRLSEVFDKLEELSAGMETEQKKICTVRKTNTNMLITADMEMILEAAGNVLGNAVRYAKERVEFWLKYEESRLFLYVRDDGTGFSERALREAAFAYFSEEKGGEKEAEEHFGIGLSISRLLCEKHGGELSVVNGTEGGGIVGLNFYVGE